MTASILGVPRARPFIELGIGTVWGDAGPAGVWDVSNWDAPDALWAASDPYWVDVTCEGLDVQTFTGRDRTGDPWEVGTATITLRNADGWADYPPTLPDTGDPYQLTVRPGRPVRVGMVVDGVATPVVFRGYIDQANPGYDASTGDIIVLECVDAKGEAGRSDAARLAAPVGDGETTTARMSRIANALGWPARLRAFDTVAIPLQATDLGANGADLFNHAAASAGGVVYGDVNGRVRLRSMDWQLWNVDVPADAVIGEYSTTETLTLVQEPDGSLLVDPVESGFAVVEDPPATGLFDLEDADRYLLELPADSDLYAVAVVGMLEVCPTSWELSFAREDFPTVVIVGHAGGAAPLPELVDVPGRDMFGRETFTADDLDTKLDADLVTIGNRILAVRGVGTAPRVAAVTIDAATADNTVDLLAYADPRTPTRVIARHRRADGVDVLDGRHMFVTSVEHDIGPESWVCRLGLDDAAPFAVGVSAGMWAPSDQAGVWDQTTWSRRAVIDPAEIGS